MSKNNICPFNNAEKEEYLNNSFDSSIKQIFSLNCLFFLIILPTIVIYYSLQKSIFWYAIVPLIAGWILAILALLASYPLMIQRQFRGQNKKMPFCGILTTAFDVLFRKNVLLRDIDVERKQKYGDIYLSFFGLRPVVVVTSAKLAEQIAKDYILFAKSDPRDLNMPFFYQWVGNNNIVLANGERWKAIRKFIHPKLNDIELFLPLMNEKINIFCDKINDQMGPESPFVSIKLTRWLKALSLDISGEALFGYNFNHLQDNTNPGIEATDYVLNEIFNPARLSLPILNKLPTQSNKRLRECIQLLDDLVLKMINYYLTQSKNTSDQQNVLSLLLAARDENFLDTHELRNNILALVLASHETTQVSLSGVLYYLAKYPLLQQQIREEANILFPNMEEIFAQHENASDHKDSYYWKLKTFETLENFMLESLRLYSPLANQNPRTTMEAVELDGYLIPKGTLISMNLHAIHMSEQEWQDAENFNPDRFKKGNRINKHAFLPFGNGPRICSGREFSLIEQKLAVCLILRKFEIRLPDPQYKVPLMRYSFTGLPDETFQLQFKRIDYSHGAH